MIEVAVPGQRCEIEFLEDGTIDIEKFISDNYILRDIDKIAKSKT